MNFTIRSFCCKGPCMHSCFAVNVDLIEDTDAYTIFELIILELISQILSHRPIAELLNPITAVHLFLMRVSKEIDTSETNYAI